MGAADRYDQEARRQEREAVAAMPFWDRFWHRAVTALVVAVVVGLMLVLGGGASFVTALFR